MIDMAFRDGVYFDCFKNRSPANISPHEIEGVIHTMRIMQGVFLSFVCLLIVFGSCRRNQPSLVDRNQPPDTELWYAPPDSSEYTYLVHLYWRGVDLDGTAVRFIWAIRDTVVLGERFWNPAERLSDFREGTITTKTDSVFAFTAYDERSGAKVNRQAFHIAAIDDRGFIDPFPATVEFIATIDEYPRMHFATHINGKTKAYVPSEIPQDTVGMFKPFSISYHGTTKNGRIRAYQYFPLSTVIEIPGSHVWNYDLSDTMLYFENTGRYALPASRKNQPFQFAAKCLDDAEAQSRISATTGRNGVAQLIVNFDPDTRIHEVRNQYTVDDVEYSRPIDFTDGIPDTVPYKSWVTLFYSGWDDPRDSVVCNRLNPDKCIDYQVRFRMERHTPEGDFSTDSNWLPRGGVHDTDTLAVADSNSVRIGPFEYDIFVQAIDENGRGDGSRLVEKAASVPIIGSYDPTLDSIVVEDHFGKRLDLSVVDTLTWNFWKGEGWPYTCWCDTVDLGVSACPTHSCPPGSGSLDFFKTFSFTIKGWGHDDPREPTGSGVKAWKYEVFNSAGRPVSLGSGGGGVWVNSVMTNKFDQRVQIRFQYPGPFPLQGDPPPDTMGDSVMANLPSWFDDDLTFVIRGRDTAARGEPRYEQRVFLNGQQRPAGLFNAGNNGRLTETKSFTFRVRLVRP